MIKKSLFFICPTDCLEPVISDVFAQENFYYSSLGNSINFNAKSVGQIKKLIRKRDINEILFVLSNDNRIVLDALGKQNYSDVRGLGSFYKKVKLQRDQMGLSWQIWDRPSLLLSYHLNKKIRELTFRLKDFMTDGLSISGKIYNREEDQFTDIYPELICMEHANLN